MTTSAFTSWSELVEQFSGADPIENFAKPNKSRTSLDTTRRNLLLLVCYRHPEAFSIITLVGPALTKRRVYMKQRMKINIYINTKRNIQIKIERQLRKEHCDRNPGERPSRAAPSTRRRRWDRLCSNGSRLHWKGNLTENGGVKHVSHTFQSAAPWSLHRSNKPRISTSARSKCAFMAYMSEYGASDSTNERTRVVGRTRLVDGKGSTGSGSLGMHRVGCETSYWRVVKHPHNLRNHKPLSPFLSNPNKQAAIQMNASKVPGHGQGGLVWSSKMGARSRAEQLQIHVEKMKWHWHSQDSK